MFPIIHVMSPTLEYPNESTIADKRLKNLLSRLASSKNVDSPAWGRAFVKILADRTFELPRSYDIADISNYEEAFIKIASRNSIEITELAHIVDLAYDALENLIWGEGANLFTLEEAKKRAASYISLGIIAARVYAEMVMFNIPSGIALQPADKTRTSSCAPKNINFNLH